MHFVFETVTWTHQCSYLHAWETCHSVNHIFTDVLCLRELLSVGDIIWSNFWKNILSLSCSGRLRRQHGILVCSLSSKQRISLVPRYVKSCGESSWRTMLCPLGHIWRSLISPNLTPAVLFSHSTEINIHIVSAVTLQKTLLLIMYLSDCMIDVIILSDKFCLIGLISPTKL